MIIWRQDSLLSAIIKWKSIKEKEFRKRTWGYDWRKMKNDGEEE